jgi:Lhr-like helicase
MSKIVKLATELSAGDTFKMAGLMYEITYIDKRDTEVVSIFAKGTHMGVSDRFSMKVSSHTLFRVHLDPYYRSFAV